MPDTQPIPHACFHYDIKADALYIGLAHNYVGRAETLTAPGGGVLIDVCDGVPVGIEVVGASAHPAFAALCAQYQGQALTRISFGCDAEHAGVSDA